MLGHAGPCRESLILRSVEQHGTGILPLASSAAERQDQSLERGRASVRPRAMASEPDVAPNAPRPEALSFALHRHLRYRSTMSTLP